MLHSLVITLPGFWLLNEYEKDPFLSGFENAPQIGLYAPRLVGSAHDPAPTPRTMLMSENTRVPLQVSPLSVFGNPVNLTQLYC